MRERERERSVVLREGRETGARGDVYMAAGSRARGIRRQLEAGRTRSRGAEKTEARGASERENRRVVEDDGADGWVPRVSEGRGSGGSLGRSDRTIGAGLAGLTRDGPGGGGEKGACELGRKEEEGEGRKEIRPRADSNPEMI